MRALFAIAILCFFAILVIGVLAALIAAGCGGLLTALAVVGIIVKLWSDADERRYQRQYEKDMGRCSR